MGNHKRLGAESAISKAGLTAQDLLLIFQSMAMRAAIQRKLIAFQYWHVSSSKNMDRFWITQGDIARLFDTLCLSPPLPDAPRQHHGPSEGLKQPRPEWRKQCIRVVVQQHAATMLQLRVVDEYCTIRLSFVSLESELSSQSVRIQLSRDGVDGQQQRRRESFYDSSLLVGSDEASCGDLTLALGCYDVLLCSEAERLLLRLGVYSTRPVTLRCSAKDARDPRPALSVGEFARTDWTTPTVDLLPDAWSSFEFKSVNMHPLLFHRLRRRTCGRPRRLASPRYLMSPRRSNSRSCLGTDDLDPRLREEPPRWHDGVRGWVPDPPPDSLQKRVQDLVLRLGFDGLWWHIASGDDMTLANEVSVEWSEEGSVQVHAKSYGLLLSEKDSIPLKAGGRSIVRSPGVLEGGLAHFRPGEAPGRLQGRIAVVDCGHRPVEEAALLASSAGAVALIVLGDGLPGAPPPDPRAERLAVDTKAGRVGEVLRVRCVLGERLYILGTSSGETQVPESAVLRYREVRESLPVLFARRQEAAILKSEEGGQARIQVLSSPMISFDVDCRKDLFGASRIAIKLLALTTRRPLEEVFVSFTFFSFDEVRDFPAFCQRHQNCSGQKEFYWLTRSRPGARSALPARFDPSDAGVTFEFVVPHAAAAAAGATEATVCAAPGELERYLASASMDLRLWARAGETFSALGRAVLPLSQLCRRGRGSVLYGGTLPLRPADGVTGYSGLADDAGDRLHVRAMNVGIEPGAARAPRGAAAETVLRMDGRRSMSHEEVPAGPARRTPAHACDSGEVPAFPARLKLAADGGALDSLIRSEQVRAWSQNARSSRGLQLV